ncbi:MAG: FlgD immunoglobulin-like domain containing protein [Candidatus Krumholzibacteriia bacterium]
MRYLLIMISVAFATTAYAQDCVEWSNTILAPTPIAGLEPGPIAVSDGILIVGGDPLQLYDPATSTLLGTIDLPAPAVRFHAEDSTLLAACGAAGLVRVDVQQHQVVVLCQPDGEVRDACLLDGNVAMVTSASTLVVCSPADGTILATMTIDHSPLSVAAVGSVALVGSGFGLQPVDCADLGAPVFGSLYHHDMYIHHPIVDIVTVGSRGYCSVDVSQYDVYLVSDIDLADPMHPALNHLYEDVGVGLAVIGDDVAMVSQDQLEIYDNTTFGLVHRWPLQGDAIGLAAIPGGDFFISTSASVFRSPTAITRAVIPTVSVDGVDGVIETDGRYRQVTLEVRDSDDETWRADTWVLDMQLGPEIVCHRFLWAPDDIGWTGLPRLLGADDDRVVFAYFGYTEIYDRTNDTWDIFVPFGYIMSGHNLWADGYPSQDLVVYDLSGSQGPTEVTRISRPMRAPRFSRDGSLVLGHGDNLLWAIGIEEGLPQTLSLIDVDFEGGTAPMLADGWFTIARSTGWRVFDYLDPSAPVDLGHVDLPLSTHHFTSTVEGGVFAVGNFEGFMILVSDDRELPVATTDVIPMDVNSMTMKDGFLYVADSLGRLSLFDVNDPYQPVLIGMAVGPSAEKPYVVDGVVHAGWSVFPLPCEATTGLEDADPGEHPDLVAPSTVRLLTPAPNPFNPRTVIRYELMQPGRVTVLIHDLAGRQVARIVDGAQTSGGHDVVWDGANDAGRPMPSGTYLVTLETETAMRSSKIVLVR